MTLTREQIENMKAGNEMDALIGRRVMGLSVMEWINHPTSRPVIINPRDKKDLPNYSTNILAAWEVVEHFTGKDCRDGDFFIECWSDGEWFVSFHPLGYSSRYPSAACDGKKTGSPSAPLAICRAALLYWLETV